MRITGGTGVNVVFDPVGESSRSLTQTGTMAESDGIGMIMPSLKCVTWNARIVVVGFAAGTIEKVSEPFVLNFGLNKILMCSIDSCELVVAETSVHRGTLLGG